MQFMVIKCKENQRLIEGLLKDIAFAKSVGASVDFHNGETALSLSTDDVNFTKYLLQLKDKLN